MKPKNKHSKRAQWIINALISRNVDFATATEYGEPGYSTDKPVIVMADWNQFNKSEMNAIESVVEIEWSDEWVTDDEGQAFRRSSDSHGWTPAWFEHDGEIVPWDALDTKPTEPDELRDYGFFISSPGDTCDFRSLPSDFDLSGIGLLVRGDCDEFHPGQNDRPEAILKPLPAGEYAFKLSGKGQFDISWEVWEILPPIERAFHRIMRSSMWRTDGEAINLPAALIELGNAVADNETDESTWSLGGESLNCDLGSLIVGAYWSCTGWHAGQSSDSYAALCALGRVFSPGMTSGPEPDSSEFIAYETCNEWFRSNAATATR